MPGIFHTQVALHGFDFQDSQLTVNLAAGITKADEGKAVAVDTSADNQVKLAGDGDEIVGVLYTVENRVVEGQLVGTVKFRFAEKLPIKEGATVARGNRLVGGGAGTVRAIDTETPAEAALAAVAPRVWAVASGMATALYL